MSGDDTEYEVILSLSELRGFPLLRAGSYRVRASLKDAVQETEEVPGSSPVILFNEDLTWTLSRSTYHSLRSRKVPIRLSVFEGEKKVGHLVLDLKEAFPLPAGTRIGDFLTHKMQSSRVLGVKKDPTLADHPSLKWLLTINTQPEVASSPEDQLQAFLDEEGGFFLIGSTPEQVFHLNIEIYFASNLHLAINKDLFDLSEEKEFYFSYDILGETITTVPFTNLKEPNFSVEEATINIHSSFSDISLYFSQQPPLCISVCSSKYILARMYFSLSQMLELTDSNLRKKGVLKSSRVFPFENSRDSSLGVSISLKNKGTVTKIPCETPPPLESESQEHCPSSVIVDHSNHEAQPSLPKEGSEVSYGLTINLSSIHFDNSVSKSIRLRYKYSPLMKNEDVDTYDFQVKPNERKSVPYGKCQLTFKADPKLCLQILRKNPLTVNVLDVKNRLKVIATSVVDLSKVLHGELLSPKSKKVEISSPVRNLVNRDIGTLESSISLLVEEGSKTINENDDAWKSKERQRIQEHFQHEWNKRETERMTSIQANLQKYDKLEQVVQEYMNKQQSLESAICEKDKKISELNKKMSLEGGKFSKKLLEISLNSQELNKSHKDELGKLSKKIKELERELEATRKSEARKDKVIHELKDDMARLSRRNDELQNEKFELQYRLNAQKKATKSSIARDKSIHDELDSVPSKSLEQHPDDTLEIKEYQRILDVESEVKRLFREKEAILKTGDYNEDDDLVLSITRKINALIVPRNRTQ